MGSLYDITQKQSGIVMYADPKSKLKLVKLVTNWKGIEGIPRISAEGTISGGCEELRVVGKSFLSKDEISGSTGVEVPSGGTLWQVETPRECSFVITVNEWD